MLIIKFNKLYKIIQKKPVKTIVCERNFKTTHKMSGKIVYKNNLISKDECNQLKKLTNELQKNFRSSFEIKFINLFHLRNNEKYLKERTRM